MGKFHGIIVDVSQKDKSIFDDLKIIGKKVSGDWVLYKVEVGVEEIEDVIEKLRDNLIGNYYFHFYKGDKLIVVFRERIFKVSLDKKSWSSVIDYGISLGIPKEQLDFYPCRIEDEEY